WKDARKKLERSGLTEIPSIQTEREKNAYISLKISYEHLKDNMSQTCFLLCALYPEDDLINVEDLVRYAWGLNLYDKANSIEEMRIQVLEVIDYLKDSCLLEDGDVGSEKKKFPDRLMHSKLEILLLNNCDIQGTCFLGMTKLKVLNLTAVYGTGVISLYALTFLPKLRALHLDNFTHYSFLGNLTTLEILSLHGWVYEDLADELEILENLKILDLINCACSGRFQSKVIRRLSQLGELYLPRSSISNDIFLEIKFLTRLRRLPVEVHSLLCPLDFEFPELENYKIGINCFSINFGYREMSGFGYTIDTTRSLKIEEVFPYNSFSQLLGNLESLEVSKINDEIDYYKNLKVVFQMEEVEENEAPLLSNLKILRLQRLQDLSCIWKLPTQHVRLESLVELTILHCPRLKSLFSLSLAQSLVLLEKLEIIYCPELKQIVTELEGDEGEISSTINSHASLSFPKLTKLYISTCDGLEYIFPTQHVRLESLVVLTIKKCPRLKSLFSLSLAQSLVQLKGLDISYCDEMKQIVTELEGDEGEISPTINSHNSLCFPELGNVSISNCYGLEYIFPTSMSPQGLQSLTLNVEACSQLKQVFRVAKDRVGNDSMLQHQQFLRSLSSFSVKRCPLLTDLVVHLEAKKASIK
ncbi:hypothetical protein Gotur_002164, partial [Gossypium turneri]